MKCISFMVGFLFFLQALVAQAAWAGEAPVAPMPLTVAESRAMIAALPETVEVAPQVKFSLSTSVVSRYVSPHGHLLSDEPLWQSEFKVIFSSGLFAGITWSTGFDDVNLSSTKADEVDLSLGWTKKLGDLSLTFGASHFNFIELDSLDKDLVIAWAEVGYSFKVSESQTLTPFLRMEERWRLPDFDWARSMPVAGLKHAWVIAPGFTFNQRVGLMYDSGVPVSDDGLLLQYRVGMSCKLSEACTLEPYLRVSAPLTIEDDRETQVILGITLSWNF